MTLQSLSFLLHAEGPFYFISVSFFLRNKWREFKYCFILDASFQGGCPTPLLTTGDSGDCKLMCLCPALAAFVGWRSWQSPTLNELVHHRSWMLLHGCLISHPSLADILSYVLSVQHFYCHWKFPMIYEIIFFWISGLVSFFSYVSLLGLARSEYTDIFQKLLGDFDDFNLRQPGLPGNVGQKLFFFLLQYLWISFVSN